MPIYEYRCENGHTFEVMQRMTEDPVVTCTTCEAPVQRVFHPVAVHFKGSGFYNTDYGKQKRSGAASDGASSDNGKPAEPAKKSDKPAESKPAAASSSD
jgi:putative FmdB family regulatory protein